jgi:hypothetical protein
MMLAGQVMLANADRGQNQRYPVGADVPGVTFNDLRFQI